MSLVREMSPGIRYNAWLKYHAWLKRQARDYTSCAVHSATISIKSKSNSHRIRLFTPLLEEAHNLQEHGLTVFYGSSCEVPALVPSDSPLLGATVSGRAPLQVVAELTDHVSGCERTQTKWMTQKMRCHIISLDHNHMD